MNETQRIALQRIHVLFRLAEEKIREEPEQAQRYVAIARRIAMRTKLRLPVEYRRMICKHCKSFIYPNANCRVRVKQRREPHMAITCLVCGKIMRIPLKTRSQTKKKEESRAN
jgi:ribonuclease P protein subunit RPR2